MKRDSAMYARTIVSNLTIAWIFVCALLCGATVSPHEAWAKHKKARSHAASNGDPCAEPTAFVKDKIAKIRVLQASQTTQATNTVFSLFSSKPHADPDVYAKISELHRDADAVNNMLRTGDCHPIDIDAELRAPSR